MASAAWSAIVASSKSSRTDSRVGARTAVAAATASTVASARRQWRLHSTKISSANGIDTSQPRLWPISVTHDSSPAQPRNRPRVRGATSRVAARYRHGNVPSTHMATLALM